MSDKEKAGWLAVIAGVLQLILQFFDRGNIRRKEIDALKKDIHKAIDDGDDDRLLLLIQRLRDY